MWGVVCTPGTKPFYNLHTSCHKFHLTRNSLSPTLPRHQQSWLKKRGEVPRCCFALIFGKRRGRGTHKGFWPRNTPHTHTHTLGGRIGQVNGWGMPAAANTNLKPSWMDLDQEERSTSRAPTSCRPSGVAMDCHPFALGAALGPVTATWLVVFVCCVGGLLLFVCVRPCGVSCWCVICFLLALILI